MLKLLTLAAATILLQIAPLNISDPGKAPSPGNSTQTQDGPPQATTIINNVDNRQRGYEREEENSVADKDPDKWARRGFELNLGLLLVTLLIAVVGAVQSFASLRQANHIVASERAWILIKRIGNPVDRLYSPDSSYRPGIVFNYQVYGNTPARVTDCRFRIDIFPRKGTQIPPVPDLPETPEYPENIFSRYLLEIKTVLPAGETFSVSVAYKSALGQIELDSLRDSKTFLCAYGFVEYESVPGKKGRTDIGYIYDFAFGSVLASPDGTVLTQAGFRIGGPPAYNKTT